MADVRVMVTPEEKALVWRIVKEVHTNRFAGWDTAPIGREDLYHFGLVGLLEAKPRFDRTRGVPWPAFAAYRVRGAMMDQLRRLPLVRLPQGLHQKVRALKSLRDERISAGKPADPETLAAEMNMTVEEVHRTWAASPALLRVEAGVGAGEDDSGPAGITMVDPDPGPDAQMERREMAALVQKCLDLLPSPEDRLIILGRVLHGLKLRELADTLGCSIENVRLRQQRVQRLLRSCMEEHGWSHGQDS